MYIKDQLNTIYIIQIDILNYKVYGVNEIILNYKV